MIRYAETRCKYCGGTVVAQWSDDDAQAAVDQFFPMLVCNACADAYRKRNDAGGMIMSLCFAYSRNREKGQVIDDVRKALLNATRAYAEAMQHILKAPELLYSERLADILIEKPEAAAEALRRYRAEVRRRATEANKAEAVA